MDSIIHVGALSLYTLIIQAVKNNEDRFRREGH